MYLLTLPDVNGVRHAASRGGSARDHVGISVRDGAPLLSFRLAAPTEVMIRYLDFNGRVLAERTFPVPPGTSRIGSGSLFPHVRNGACILELQSGTFHVVQVVKLLR